MRGKRSCGGGEEDLGGASGISTLVALGKHDVYSHSRVAGFGSGRGFVTK